MIAAIFGLFSSSAFGVFAGLLGNWLNKFDERQNQKLLNAHEIRMRELDFDEAAREHRYAIEIENRKIDLAQEEGKIAVEIADADAFKVSQIGAGKLTGILWVDMIRGLMRPIITAYLLGIATYFTWKIGTFSGGVSSLDRAELTSLYVSILSELIFLTTMAVTWWFGSRTKKPSAE